MSAVGISTLRSGLLIDREGLGYMLLQAIDTGLS
jgi:hypothetical protein